MRAGEISARELVQCSLDRIEELNPALNAFVDVDADGALRTADQIAGGDSRPFAGVPIAIKNNRAVAGMRLTQGSRLLADHVAGYDHSVVQRLRGAGFIIVGTTTLPEFGILPTTEARLFGPTHNPWSPARPAAPPAARPRRLPRASCPSPTAMTAVDRSAFRLHAVAGRPEAEPRARLRGAGDG